MKQRPILFSGPMVRAILDGRKTQTRRVVKELPSNRGNLVGDHVKWFERGVEDATRWCGHDGIGSLGWVRCPHGEPGDRLWVRETWTHDADDLEDARAQHEDALSASPVSYRAGMTDDEAGIFARWWPSIHMPRWASRITLEIADVRVQRLQEITEDDARSEGVHRNDAAVVFADGVDGFNKDLSWTARGAFAVLWDSINGKRAPWSSNPWVWAITFRRVP